jgi:SOS-response transcriptional repressor LexA
MSINEKIFNLRRDLHLTQAQFGDKLNVSWLTIHRYETNKTKPKDKFFKKVMEVFGEDLLAESTPHPAGAFPLPGTTGWRIPVIGICDAGTGISSSIGYPPGYSDEWLSRPAGLKDWDAYALRIPEGAYSMFPALKPGMFCVISPNTECKSGDMAVVQFRDGCSTIKEVHFKNNEIELRAYNDDYETKTVNRSELVFPPAPVVWWRKAK